MKTVTIQIGNTDNRLSQQEWSRFVAELSTVVADSKARLHFFGAPPNWERRQNVAWVVEADDAQIAFLQQAVAAARQRFNQEAAAFTVGETAFI